MTNAALRCHQRRLAVLALALVPVVACGSTSPARRPVSPPAATAAAPAATALSADLDAILANSALERAFVAMHVESLADGRVVYSRNAGKLAMPASNMKILTLAAAAERLGWDYTFDTRLEAAGVVEQGVLNGDLVVTGSGDPTIVSLDFAPARLFAEWAAALRAAGIHAVHGRIVGDDNAFDDDGFGPGWAWDYLNAGYAAPSGALSYNENVAVVRIWPAAAAGTPARIEITPEGHSFAVVSDVTTGTAGSRASVTVSRWPGSARLVIRGTVPAGGSLTSRTTTIHNPTQAFVEGLRRSLADHGIHVTDGAMDIDDVSPLGDRPRTLVAVRRSLPLSAIAGDLMKSSQNFYAETLLKAIGRTAGTGSVEQGRRVVRETLAGWKVQEDATVIYDGSGLSRYNYVTAAAITTVLAHVWHDERLRGPFVATLPVGGHDGTLSSRMRNGGLRRRVQAKTGSIANVRALSGYLETDSGEKLVFSTLVNHFTAPAADVDRIVEAALERLLTASK